MPRVKLPNGQTASFPENMSLQEIQSAIESDPNSGALPGVPKAPIPAGLQGPPSAAAQPPSLLQRAGSAAADLGAGAVQGLAHTSNIINKSFFGDPSDNNSLYVKSSDSISPALANEAITPSNAWQRIGYGGEQIGEFLVPGGAEKRLSGELAAAAPQLGKWAAPLARTATSALSSGAVNKAQGGGFGTGAIAGTAGGALSEGLRATAPWLAETSLGIRGKFDRAFGKDPGLAALTETTGFRPATVAKQAADRLGDLSGQVESMADAASVRPNPVRGLLPAPAREIPLAETPGANPQTRPMAFPADYQNAPSTINADIESPQYLSGSAHPELSGRTSTPQGVLIRPFEAPAGAPPISPTVPNRMASLYPARNVLDEAMSTAERQNALGVTQQLQPMQDTLRTRFTTGAPIPEQVTPRELLDLRRGFNAEHGSWNPERREPAVAAARRAYGALTGEFHDVLPQAAPLEERVSSLIPVKNRAQIRALSDNELQQVLSRFGKPTGALTGAAFGGYEGKQQGGIPGMIGGALGGLAVPAAIASPTVQMMAARMLYKGATPIVKTLLGGGMQAARSNLYRGQ